MNGNSRGSSLGGGLFAGGRFSPIKRTAFFHETFSVSFKYCDALFIGQGGQNAGSLFCGFFPQLMAKTFVRISPKGTVNSQPREIGPDCFPKAGPDLVDI